jgi:hypothetical protein
LKREGNSGIKGDLKIQLWRENERKYRGRTKKKKEKSINQASLSTVPASLVNVHPAENSVSAREDGPCWFES